MLDLLALMPQLKAKVLINGTDIAQKYNAFLVETHQGGADNLNALLRYPELKPTLGVAFREENGKRMPSKLRPQYEPHKFTLHFGILVYDSDSWRIMYARFMDLMHSGWLTLNVNARMTTFTPRRVYCKACGKVQLRRSFWGDEPYVYGTFSITFAEPQFSPQEY